jgi:hypothetical protein
MEDFYKELEAFLDQEGIEDLESPEGQEKLMPLSKNGMLQTQEMDHSHSIMQKVPPIILS